MKHFRRFLFIRHILTHPRLAISAVMGGMLLLVMPETWRSTTRLLLAWNAGTGLYLLLVARMMICSNMDKIRLRAAAQDEGRVAVLVVTVLASITSLAAIVAELATAKTLHGSAQLQHIGIAGLTVILSWTFMQTMFALHYAHEYYMDKAEGPAKGLDFPGDQQPDYWDFVYFSFVIGTAAQTADINITCRLIRRIVTIHCVIAFFFNATILALTVNIGASLF